MSETASSVHEANKGASLPEWDLSDLYAGPDSPELKADLAEAEREAKALAADYRGKLKTLSGAAFAEAIRRYERLDERLSRILSYAQLLYARDMSDEEVGRFQQAMSERATDISSNILFFPLELNAIDDAVIDRQLAHPDAARYAPWVRDSRAFRPHQLDETQELLLHDKHVTGRSAWTRLFDETMTGLRIPVGGRELSVTETLNLLSSTDSAVRKEAAQSLGKVLTGNVRLFALITNTLAKDKEIEDRWRKFARPVSSRNLENRVSDDVVDALVTAVRANYANLAHRYYKLKAGWFGTEQLDYWDRNAPLPDAPDRVLSWDEARQTVLGAYRRFSPDLAAVGEKFFQSAWIDAPIRPGKAPGAFAHPTVPSAHPYLLVNYDGRVRDVMTLAHELGHGVHQVLAGQTQGHLLSGTPLTLAETASVFGEMLTFQALLEAETDRDAKRLMLASKVEDMLNTVVRQVAFHEFETKVHGARRDGELSAAQLGEIWLEVQTASLGPALRFDADYTHYWAYIPHFIHSPFYVYAYAFGDCLVNSLYSVYQDAAPGFAEKYLDMLRAGGTKHHKELLAPFGLDATDPNFWARGLSVVSGFIDQLEQA
jgi:oligoendopeptidase F